MDLSHLEQQTLFNVCTSKYTRNIIILYLSLHHFLLQTLIIVPGSVTSLQVRPTTTIFGLIITWGPPSGSNYPTPVTYRLRYRERPYNGPLYGWSRTIYRSTYQRQYTTPVLTPGTRYEVEVWPVSSSSAGSTRQVYVTTGENQHNNVGSMYSGIY